MVVLTGMEIKLHYNPKPKNDKPEPIVNKETERKYYVISPNGNIDNKPLGLQIVGNFLDESTILNFAHMYQKETNWHDYTPEGVKQWVGKQW